MGGLMLPQDVEKFLTDGFSQLHDPAVYALKLDVPKNIESEWDRYHDEKPDYLEEIQNSKGCVYVGAAKDLLARLSDHKGGDVRLTVLTEVCEIDGIRNIWWVDSPDRRFIEESKLATMLQNERPEIYVHSR
jgi:hypothetical protein